MVLCTGGECRTKITPKIRQGAGSFLMKAKKQHRKATWRELLTQIPRLVCVRPRGCRPFSSVRCCVRAACCVLRVSFIPVPPPHRLTLVDRWTDGRTGNAGWWWGESVCAALHLLLLLLN